jgi:predicted metal-dependent enzyme (double-stranded beta helix superfamily)
MPTHIDPETLPGLRRTAVSDTIDRVRRIAEGGIDRSKLEDIKQTLLRLAAREELFPISEFVAIAPGTSALYRLSEDADHRFALYVACPEPGRSTAPHDHTTWAVIAGVHGREHNRLYRRTSDPDGSDGAMLEQVGALDVVPGVGLALMPEDIHSIHLGDDGPHVNLHLYGLSVEHTHARTAFDLQSGTTKTFPAASGVKLARGGV